jgi:hypothetical protein
MKKTDLQRIGVGFYTDDNGSVYLDVKESLHSV